MYEAKQNKEKVSRRIEGRDNGTQQKVKTKTKTSFPHFCNSVQFMTNIIYKTDPLINMYHEVAYIIHNRVQMTNSQKNMAYKPSGYTPAFGESCNHFVPYVAIHKGVENLLISDGLFKTLRHFGYAIQDGQSYPMNLINRSVDNIIDDYANDYHNLFYAPKHTGDNWGRQIDYPVLDDKNEEATMCSRLEEYLVILNNMGII